MLVIGSRGSQLESWAVVGDLQNFAISSALN